VWLDRRARPPDKWFTLYISFKERLPNKTKDEITPTAAIFQYLCFQLIKMLAEVTNVSTAILYELLLTLQKMNRNNSALRLTKLLDGVALVRISLNSACPLTL
jgi:hypothetical protein